MVSTLVGGIFLGLSEEQRARCDRDAVVAALNDLIGGGTVDDLRDIIEEDPGTVKESLSKVAMPLLFARIKQAVRSPSSPPSATLGGAVGGGGAASPSPFGTAVPGVNVSVGVENVGGTLTIKHGVTTVVNTHGFTAPSTDSYDMLRIAGLEKYAPNRMEELRALPASVKTYQSPRHTIKSGKEHFGVDGTQRMASSLGHFSGVRGRIDTVEVAMVSFVAWRV